MLARTTAVRSPGKDTMRFTRTSLAALAAMAIAAGSAEAQTRAKAGTQATGGGEFVHSERTDAEMARRLGIPVYFAVPSSARVAMPSRISTTDRLIDFKHPDARGADDGLRIVVAKRAGMGQRLARAGILQTGDILLTFRPEWGGAGSYPNIQMGISHAGVVHVRDGVAHQLDNPMDAVYLGGNFRGDFNNEHYRTLTGLHVIRPRGLTDTQRANIQGWASRLLGNARKIYPSQIAFNQDYNAPKFTKDRKLEFVNRVGQSALGLAPRGKTDLFCSEFVWAVLALRDCDPTATDAFRGSGVPACVSPIMEPLRVTGSYMTRRGLGTNAGLADGPLMVLDSMKLSPADRDPMIAAIFKEDPAKVSRMSAGHRKLAQDLSPKFAHLQQYYQGAAAGGLQRVSAWYVSTQFRRQIPDNYSPTSFLINTLLPPNNSNRKMDYVATLLLE